MEYVRYCPKCGRKKIYRSLDSFRANKNSLLCRKCARQEVFSKLYPNKIEKLLEDTPETYYWIGYLLADGNFSNNNRIKFSQSNEDQISVEKFKKYIEWPCDTYYNEKLRKSEFSVMNINIVPKIMEKFDIKHNKTYCPPDKKIFEDMDVDLLAYLFIGFVDGDGHIANLHNRPDYNLRIKVHSSWYDTLNVFIERLFGLTGYVKINNQGYADLAIGNSQILKQFKKKYFENISFEPLHRKWDVIDLNYVGKYEQAKITLEKVKELYEQNYSVKDICKTLNLTEGLVYKDIKKIKNEEV